MQQRPLNVKIERIETAETEIERMTAEEVQMRTLYMQDGVIDDTEQDALDRIKGKIDQLRTVVADLRAEVEENQRIWESHAGEWAEAQNKLQALQDFRHSGAAPMTTAVGEVTQAAADQRWADATSAFQQVQTNLGPTWADYEIQVAARDEYDPLRVDFNTRLAAAAVAQPQTELISGPVASIRASVASIDSAVATPDFVAALEQLRVSVSELEAVEAEIIRLQTAKADYDSALASLEPRLTDSSVCEYEALTEQHTAIVQLQSEMEAAAGLHNYEVATPKLQELSGVVDNFLSARDELNASRAAYEAKLAKLSGRLTAASSSELATTSELQQSIITAEDAMKASAEAQNFDEALGLADDVDAALTAYEAVIEDRDLYLARLDAMGDELLEASVSKPEWGYLEPIQAAMAATQTEMETAAEAEDFATALTKISAVEGKLVEFYAAIEAKKAEYEAARGPLDPRLSHAGECGYPLATQIGAVTAAVSAIDAAVGLEDWEGALNGVASAEAAIDAFDTAHAAHHATLIGQINTALGPLRAAASDPANLGLTSTTTLTSNIASIDSSIANDKDLIEVFDVITRSEAIEAQLATVRDIRDRIDGTWDEDGEAMELYNELKGDLAELPVEARNMLVEALLDEDGFFDDVDDAEQAAVKDIWSAAPNIDPAFENADAATTSRIVDQLEGDPQVQEYAANWNTMPPAEQQAAMKHIGDIIGGPEGWDIEGVEDIEYDIDGGDCLTDPLLMGSHGEATETTNETINVCMSNTNGDWNPSTDFNDVVLNLTHEVGHGYQETLIEEYNSGDMDRSNPNYEQAKMLSLDRQYFEESTIAYGDDWDAYVHSPMEQHSRRTSNRVRGELPPEFGAGHNQALN